MSAGNLIGRKHLLTNLPWRADHDPLEQTRPTDTHFEPDPVAPLNNVTIYVFLGVPYAEPPVSTRRFKVRTCLLGVYWRFKIFIVQRI